MKKIKIFILLVFFLIISAVFDNVFAAKKTMLTTDLIHIYNDSTNFDFTVTNNTTIDQIRTAYNNAGKTVELKTDSCFGGSAYSFWHDNYTDYLYVETTAGDDYVVSYGTVWNQFQTYEYDYGDTLNYMDTSHLQGFTICEGLIIRGGVFYNRNRIIGSDLLKTSALFEAAYNNNPTRFQNSIAQHAVAMYIAISKVNGYECNIEFNEDYFYINEQLKETGISLREYIERMNKSNLMTGIGTKDNVELTNGNYFMLNPAIYADMFYSKPLNKVDRTGDNKIAIFDFNKSTKVLSAILVSPEVFNSYKNVELTDDEVALYSAAQAEYVKAMRLLNSDSAIYSTNPVISPANSLVAGTLLENKKLGIVSYFNSIRIAAGLPTVEASSDHFTVAQHMATLMSYRWNSLHLEITHSPSQPNGVSNSFFSTAIGEGRNYAENISRSANETSVNLMKRYVNMFLDDQSETPMNFSHRSLLLTPKFNKFGYGISPNIGVIEINGTQSNDVFLKAWPANGITFMESLVDDQFYWTAQFIDRYTVDKSSTIVTVKCLNTDEIWNFTAEENSSNRKYEIRTTYSSELNNMLVFYDSQIVPKNNYVYEIEIGGLKDSQGRNASYKYRAVFKYADVNNIPTVASEVHIDKSNLSLVSGENNIYYIPVGEDVKLNVVLDDSVTDKKVSWQSSNPDKVTVTQNGIVHAYENTGDVAITLVYDADADVTDVVILRPYVKVDQVKLAPEGGITMDAGQANEEIITIQTIPEEADEVVNIDWVVVTQAEPSIEYSCTDPKITKYLNITKIDDRNISVKAISAEAGNNNFTIRAKVTGVSADFTGNINVKIRVPLQSLSFSNNNQYNTGLSIIFNPDEPYTETIDFNKFYEKNKTDIIRFKVNYRPSNTTVLRECDWKVTQGTDVIEKYVEEGAFKVKAPGQASIVISSKEQPDITAQLDLTITCTMTNFTIAQPDQVVFLEKKNGSFTKTIQLKVNREPSIATEQIFFTPSDSSIATVDDNGNVTFTGKTGTVTINARNINNKITDSVTFYVKIPVSSISISRNPVELKPGDTYTRTATVNPEESNAQNYIVYSSDNTSVATVNQNGVVTAKSSGVAKISAYIDEAYTSSGTSITATYYVYVSVPLEGIEINGPEEATLENGPIKFNYTLNPPNTSDEISVGWSSSDNEIASIDQNGNVTLKDIGYVTITLEVYARGKIKSTTFKKSQVLVVNSIYQPAYLKGDLDRNGVVDAADASIALELYKSQQWSSMDIKIGDMDNNFTIDANDASLILEVYKTNN